MRKIPAVGGPRSPYNEAANLMNQVLSNPRKKSLKNLAYDKDSQLRVSASTYAIVSKVCDHRNLLEKLMLEVPVSANNMGLLYVLLFELLLSEKQSIVGGGALKRAILEKETELRKALTKLGNTRTAGNQDNTQTTHSLLHKIRYIRVNTCRTTTQQVMQKLQSLQIPVFSDPHVPDLLVMDRRHTSKILQQEQKLLFHNMRDIILQDKSSCFSALCLTSMMMESSGDVLDACAAPGNKTSHLAASLPIQSTIFALDRDAKRFKLLKKRMQELIPPVAATGSNHQKERIIVKHQDFLETRPSDFPSICAILLDPSCSGSGIRNEPIDEERLKELAKFQIAALSHAMKFPNVQYVVYSTCSIETLENEHVMGSCKNAEWEIVAPVALASWKRRGLSHPSLTPEESQCLIRVHPEEDDSNGFFVGCWQRRNNDTVSKNAPRPYTLPTALAPVFSRDAWKKVTMAIPPNSANRTTHDKKRKQCIPESQTKLVSKPPKRDGQSKMTKIQPKAESQAGDDDNDQQICKKRLKKMEWKRKQREQKRARLEAKQK